MGVVKGSASDGWDVGRGGPRRRAGHKINVMQFSEGGRE